VRRALPFFILLALMTFAVSAVAESSGRILKVLPQFLDLQGRHALSPSLYDRDAYQAHLRAQPEERSGLQFNVRWKASVPRDSKLTLRVEMRGGIGADGITPQARTLERDVKRRTFACWNTIALTGDDYKSFGELTAWRVTLWDGDQLLGEQKSFLW
jgi:hypothetical protein